MQSTIRRFSDLLGVISRIALWLSGAGLVADDRVHRLAGMGTLCPQRLVQMDRGFLGAADELVHPARCRRRPLREGNHLSFDILIHVLPDKLRKVLFSISDLVVLVFAGGMVVYGVQLAAQTWQNTMPMLGLPGGVQYLALTTGGVLMVLFSLERLLRRAVGLPTRRFRRPAGRGRLRWSFSSCSEPSRFCF